MNHSFDIEHAKTFGVTEAIFISNFEFWLAKNAGNNRHVYDGRVWTYNSVKAFSDLFPYLSSKQVRTAIDNLVLRGVLLRGNYNANTYDRTAWFAFTDEFMVRSHLPHRANGVAQNGTMHLPHRANGVAPQGKSLTSTDINTDINILPAAPTALLAVDVPVEKVKKEAKVLTADDLATQAACKATWAAYSTAYRIKYGAEPVRNAKVNSAVKAFVARLGHDESPSVAEFFVSRVNEPGVTRATHDFGLLLARAESYRTQWATGRTAEESSPNSETPYQRSMRLRVAEVSPLLARAAPGEAPKSNPTDFFRTVEAVTVIKTIGVTK